MARLIAYSDHHWSHNWPEFNSQEADGRTRWLNVQLRVWHQIHQLARQHKAVCVVSGGDTFHRRSYIHTTVNNTVLDLYKELEIPEVLCGGNHGRHSTQFNADDALDHIGLARVVPTPTGEPINFIQDGEPIHIYGALPGGEIPKPTTLGTNILLAHGMLNGATSQSGFELKGGYTLSDFAGWSCVILGDCHAKQLHGNVLIPGSTMQHTWGDTALDCGCWLVDTQVFNGVLSSAPTVREAKVGDVTWYHIGESSIGVRFLPLSSPRFINVNAANFDEVMRATEAQPDTTNYYDFKLETELDQDAYREIKRRCPQSYLVAKQAETARKPGVVSISSKSSGPQEILERYHTLRVKTAPAKEFVEEGLRYLLTADPKQKARGHKKLEILWMRAENFGPFRDVRLDITSLTEPLYQVTGTSDDETSTVNGTGKSFLATEVLCWVLYDKLARSSRRSKDALVHNPMHAEKATGMLCEVGLRVEGVTYAVQRFRKHETLGTGSRVLQGVSEVIPAV